MDQKGPMNGEEMMGKFRGGGWAELKICCPRERQADFWIRGRKGL